MDLIQIVKNNGIKIAYIAKQLNMTRQTFYNRCSKFGFSDKEKTRLISIMPDLSVFEKEQIKKYKKMKKKFDKFVK